MNLKRAVTTVGVMGAVGVGGLMAAPAVASAATTTTTPVIATATAGAWPAQVDQRPDFKAGSAAGYYIWHNSYGWHLEVTHATHDHDVFSGYVTTNGKFWVRRVDDERNDIVRVGPQRHEMSFAFNNYGYLDGVHFRTDGGTDLTFHLFYNGHPIAVSAVNLGKDSIHPTGNPFEVSRTQL